MRFNQASRLPDVRAVILASSAATLAGAHLAYEAACGVLRGVLYCYQGGSPPVLAI